VSDAQIVERRSAGHSITSESDPAAGRSASAQTSCRDRAPRRRSRAPDSAYTTSP
jgi:hypothetical protein